MSVAEVYINYAKGNKVALRVVNTEASADKIAHYALDDFENGDEDIQYVNILRVLYSGNVVVWRGASSSGNAAADGLFSALTTTGLNPVMKLSGNGDFDLSKSGIVYQPNNDQSLSVEVGNGGTCFLHLKKGSHYLSSY